MFETGLGGGLGVLVLGLAIGMQHALEADHVAAVSSIAARQSSIRRIVTHGTVWGFGHTITLMFVAGGAVIFDFLVSDSWASWLEFLVGLMLVGLGTNVIAGLIRERIHFHSHRHQNGKVHFHAHSHRQERAPHNLSLHDHDHESRIPIRSLLVGMMHGMAGSAALLVLTAATVKSVPLGLSYILLFGVGSILGMAALSAVIAVPLAWSARALGWANGGLQGGIGLATVALGAFVAVTSMNHILTT